jgi:TetR/AcrR family transcriptional regulator, transcriptional repressor for nem operon
MRNNHATNNVQQYLLGRQVEASAAKTGRLTHAQAMVIAAPCIGGMVLARVSEEAAIADEVREVARAAAMTIGGWTGCDA